MIDQHLKANYVSKKDVRDVGDGVQSNRKAIVDTNSRIDSLEDETKNGIASISAMSVLDFDSTPVGALGVGAALGGYGDKQAVAVGMVYGVNENFKINGKVGFSTDEIEDVAWGISGTYYFR